MHGSTSKSGRGMATACVTVVALLMLLLVCTTPARAQESGGLDAGDSDAAQAIQADDEFAADDLGPGGDGPLLVSGQNHQSGEGSDSEGALDDDGVDNSGVAGEDSFPEDAVELSSPDQVAADGGDAIGIRGSSTVVGDGGGLENADEPNANLTAQNLASAQTVGVIDSSRFYWSIAEEKVSGSTLPDDYVPTIRVGVSYEFNIVLKDTVAQYAKLYIQSASDSSFQGFGEYCASLVSPVSRFA